jgi:hypothetical protein
MRSHSNQFYPVATNATEARRQKLKRKRQNEKHQKRKEEEELKDKTAAALIWQQLLLNPEIPRFMNEREMRLCCEGCNGAPITGQHRCSMCQGFTHGYCARLIQDIGIIKCVTCRTPAEEDQLWVSPPVSVQLVVPAPAKGKDKGKGNQGKKPATPNREQRNTAISIMAKEAARDIGISASSASLAGVTQPHPVSSIKPVV